MSREFYLEKPNLDFPKPAVLGQKDTNVIEPCQVELLQAQIII